MMQSPRERKDDSFILVLVAGTIVPDWLSNYAVVKDGVIKRKNIHDDPLEVAVRLVELPGDTEAIFIPHGGVMVRMPWQAQYSPAFGPLQVMEIRRSREVERNRELCLNCMQFAVKITSWYQTKAGHKKINFRCAACRHEWTNTVVKQSDQSAA
ncbi:MAG: hypothetical protein WC931_02085 [Bacilli bacterium]|jgi:hypothetical protein